MKICRFVKKVFFIVLTISSSFTNAIPWSCISMKNQECKTRPQVFNVNSNNPIIYPLSIKTSKCRDNCNNINILIYCNNILTIRMQKFITLKYLI